DLKHLGFDLEDFGSNSLIIHGIPSDLKESSVQEVIENVIEAFKNESNLKLNQREALAYSMSKKTAIKSGTELSRDEMQNLLDRLFASRTPFTAPDGKLTFLLFSLEEIKNLFEKGK